MHRFSGVTFLLVMTAGVVLVRSALADEKEAKVTIERAIKSMGGEEKLAGTRVFSAKGRGKVTLEGADYEFTFEMATQGLDKFRSSYEVEVGGNKFEGATVLDGDKGWKKREGEVKKLDGEALALEKRNAYLDVVPLLLVPLRGNGFKVDSAADEKVGDRPVAVVRVTGPDGKDFTLVFDKESGLPTKMSGSVADEQGLEDYQETTFEDYKEFEGIKVATRSRTERGGKRYIDSEVLEFRTLGGAEPATFAEPK